MPFQDSPWTDEKVEYLRVEWAKQEKSAGVIAREIGGISRNAVISKARRLNLTPRKARAPTVRIQPKPKHRKRANGRKHHPVYNKHRPTTRLQRLEALRELPKPTEKTIPRIKPDPYPIGPEGGIPFMELKRHHCRWPRDNGNFCGEPIPANADRYCPKYCAHHIKRATVPTVTPQSWNHPRYRNGR